jgi:hypothetical protein
MGFQALIFLRKATKILYARPSIILKRLHNTVSYT